MSEINGTVVAITGSGIEAIYLFAGLRVQDCDEMIDNIIERCSA